MDKTDGALSQTLENLQSAYHLIQNTMQLLPQCGSLAILSEQVSQIQIVLNSMTEIASALMDFRLRSDDLPF